MSLAKRPWSAEDLYDLQQITSAQIAPTGSHIAYTLQRVDRPTEKKYSNIWLVDTAEGKPRQFTYGNQSEGNIHWSPDGQTIAFVSNRGDEKQAQIYLIPLHGGEARPLTRDLKGHFGGFAWSPDGSKLAMMFRKTDAAVLEREKDENKKKLGVTARHITDVFYRSDGATYNPQENWHIWTVDATTGEAKQLTDGEFDETQPTWSPDGRFILFISNRHPNRYFDELDADEFYRIPPEGGEIEKLDAHQGSKSNPVYSPDGQWIAYLGSHLRPGKWWQNTCLYIVPADGGEAQNLSVQHDIECSNHTSGDFGSPPPLTSPIWAADGQAIYVTIARHGGDHLGRLTLEGELSYVVKDGFVNGAFSMDEAQSKLAYIHLEPTSTGQVWLREMGSGETRPLTAVNREILEAREFGQIEEVWFKGQDGNDLQGWIHTPYNFDPSQKYPSILEIHGGPQTQYGNTFMHEFHYLVAQGYVVYYCNPRGGQGYGEAHGSAISGRWGTVDYDDLMSWTDLVASKPYIDTERMGVTGGSYGGYMTMMVVGKTHRFKAAASQRMVSNLISFHGTSDFNWGVKHLVGLEGEPWNNLEDYWRMSPISLIGNVQTPTLVIHSENDLRCDKEQGEQVFVALKLRGIPTELILFPEESHGLSRGGRTDRRVARLEHIARWMNQWVV